MSGILMTLSFWFGGALSLAAFFFPSIGGSFSSAAFLFFSTLISPLAFLAPWIDGRQESGVRY
jgi:hypothetical protein